MNIHRILDDHLVHYPARDICVGVSGGPDSMALCHMLSQRGMHFFAVTVDHALRLESGAEAKTVAEILSPWPGVRHEILRWDGPKPERRVLEEARNARYDLMESFMTARGCRDLFIAHHEGDQAETFLIRLAKGSGLDGLCAMQPLQKRGDIHIHRPFLSVPKESLVAYCHEHDVPFIRDVTNENEKYLRPRLRSARDVLQGEGLSDKRLSVTAARLARARAALETLSSGLFEASVKHRDDNGFTFDWDRLKTAPDELIFRVLLRAVEKFRGEEAYAPRMESMESLLDRLLKDPSFKSATLAGCLFVLNRRNGTLAITKEKLS